MNPDFRVGGSWRTITRGEVYLGGSWRMLTRGEIYKGGAWHTLFTFVSPMTASASPPTAFGEGNSPHSVIVSSGTVTVTPGGGLGPYTYSWSAPDVTVRVPASANTDFYATLLAGQEIGTVASCLVTDSLGATATANVPVTLINSP